MIRIAGYCANKKNKEERNHDIGFQFMVYRHQRKLRLKDIARRTGCGITELDKFELGSGDIIVFMCLYNFYKVLPELDGEAWEMEIKR